MKQRQAKAVGAMLCAKENETAEAVEHLKKECEDLKHALGEKEKALIRCMAETVPAGEEAVCLFPDEIEGESMRLLMNRVLEGGHVLCAVFCRNGGNSGKGGNNARKPAEEAGKAGGAAVYRYVIGSRGLDTRALARELNAAFCGRGGGRPEMVQGTAEGSREEIEAWILEKAGNTV